jgi:hypothetical protein
MDNNIFSHIPYQDLSTRSDLSEGDRQNRTSSFDRVSNSNINGCDTSFDSHSHMQYPADRPDQSSWLNVRSWFSNRFTANIFHSIKNNSYEVYIMYGLIVLILILMIAMTIDSIYDTDKQIYLLKKAELPRS